MKNYSQYTARKRRAAKRHQVGRIREKDVGTLRCGRIRNPSHLNYANSLDSFFFGHAHHFFCSPRRFFFHFLCFLSNYIVTCYTSLSAKLTLAVVTCIQFTLSLIVVTVQVVFALCEKRTVLWSSGACSLSLASKVSVDKVDTSLIRCASIKSVVLPAKRMSRFRHGPVLVRAAETTK